MKTVEQLIAELPKLDLNLSYLKETGKKFKNNHNEPACEKKLFDNKSLTQAFDFVYGKK